MFGLSFGLVAALGVAAVLALAGVSYKIYSVGYENGEAVWQTKYEQLISDYNEAATKEALKQIEREKRIRELENQLIVETEEKEQALEEIERLNEQEATNDPNASRPALGPDSVQRLNRIN